MAATGICRKLNPRADTPHRKMRGCDDDVSKWSSLDHDPAWQRRVRAEQKYLGRLIVECRAEADVASLSYAAHPNTGHHTATRDFLFAERCD